VSENEAQNGASVGGDAGAGRDFVGRDQKRADHSNNRRNTGNDSHDIIVGLEENNRGLSSLYAKLLEMAVDIKLLQAMSQERAAQIESLSARMSMQEKALFVMSMALTLFVLFVWRGA
jgi:hypothetical protein